MGLKIYLDDIRIEPENFDIRVETGEELIRILKTEKVDFLSLDHDLGEGMTGYDVALFIEEAAYNDSLSRIEWAIHSANPVGRWNIMLAMKNADKFWTLAENKEN